MIPIVPAIIPKSESHLRQTLSHVGFSNEIHLDVVDGQFVKNVSWPYDPAADPKDIKPYTDQFTLEVDLMVIDPLQAGIDWVTAGADMLVFHLETVSLENFKNFEAYSHVSVGISAHGDTTTEAIIEYAQYADYVQLMGIHEIGAMQQPFDESVLETIAAVKYAHPDKSITVDGSVNAHTIKRLADAGADRFIVGSAVTLQDDPQAAHAALSDLIN